eukprot:7377347-Prymnesium_polylepis.1
MRRAKLSAHCHKLVFELRGGRRVVVAGIEVLIRVDASTVLTLDGLLHIWLRGPNEAVQAVIKGFETAVCELDAAARVLVVQCRGRVLLLAGKFLGCDPQFLCQHLDDPALVEQLDNGLRPERRLLDAAKVLQEAQRIAHVVLHRYVPQHAPHQRLGDLGVQPQPDVATLLLPATSTGEPELPEA